MNSVQVFSGFSVDDREKAKDFYTNVLGLELADETMGLRFNLPGGGTVFAYEKADHLPASFTILNFVVEDIDLAVDELINQGVTFERYPDMGGMQDEKDIMRHTDHSNSGPSIAWFRDPAGNILSVIEANK